MIKYCSISIKYYTLANFISYNESELHMNYINRKIHDFRNRNK